MGLLVRQSRAFLDKHPPINDGFDWYIAICFLVCSGNMERLEYNSIRIKWSHHYCFRCKNFCVSLSQLPSVNLIWIKYSEKFGGFWLENFNQHLNVLMAENTIIYTALKVRILLIIWYWKYTWKDIQIYKLYKIQCLMRGSWKLDEIDQNVKII